MYAVALMQSLMRSGGTSGTAPDFRGPSDGASPAARRRTAAHVTGHPGGPASIKQRFLETVSPYLVDSLRQPSPLGNHHGQQLADAPRQSRFTHRSACFLRSNYDV